MKEGIFGNATPLVYRDSNYGEIYININGRYEAVSLNNDINVFNDNTNMQINNSIITAIIDELQFLNGGSYTTLTSNIDINKVIEKVNEYLKNLGIRITNINYQIIPTDDALKKIQGFNNYNEMNQSKIDSVNENNSGDVKKNNKRLYIIIICLILFIIGITLIVIFINKSNQPKETLKEEEEQIEGKTYEGKFALKDLTFYDSKYHNIYFDLKCDYTYVITDNDKIDARMIESNNQNVMAQIYNEVSSGANFSIREFINENKSILTINNIQEKLNSHDFVSAVNSDINMKTAGIKVLKMSFIVELSDETKEQIEAIDELANR